jgi:hypothetical protein
VLAQLDELISALVILRQVISLDQESQRHGGDERPFRIVR